MVAQKGSTVNGSFYFLLQVFKNQGMAIFPKELTHLVRFAGLV